MDSWNENIWWSYAPIPLLVAVFLRAEGKWSLAGFALDTMKLTFVKFVITFLAANLLWAYWGTPGTGLVTDTAVATEAGPPSFEPRPAPVASALEPDRLGDLSGVVRDASDQPVAGALIWIDAGLERHRFAAPADGLVLENDGQGFSPSLAVTQTFRPLVLRALGSELHTVVLTDARGRRLFNYPVLAEREREVMFSRAHGLLELSCSVHGAAEGRSRLLVTGNPFHGWTDDQGRFRLRGLPEGELVLAVLAPARGEQRLPTRVRAGEETSVRVSLRGAAIR